MERRRFLGLAAGALALPRLAFAADGLRLGFSLYGMKSLSLDQALKTCAETGYRDVEPALLPGYPSDPPAFSAEARSATALRLRELGLEVPCLMANLSLTAEDPAPALQRIAEAARLGRDLQPGRAPLLETVLGGKPAAWEAQKAAMAERLRAWASAAEKAEIGLALKAHVLSAVTTPERLLWLLDQAKSPALHVAFDYSHFELQGIGLEDALNALLPRTRFIHVKDTAGGPEKFDFLLPGDGRTDYAAYFAALKRHGYAGPVCVEVSARLFSQPGYDPVAAARRSFAALSAARSKAGD